MITKEMIADSAGWIDVNLAWNVGTDSPAWEAFSSVERQGYDDIFNRACKKFGTSILGFREETNKKLDALGHTGFDIGPLPIFQEEARDEEWLARVKVTVTDSAMLLVAQLWNFQYRWDEFVNQQTGDLDKVLQPLHEAAVKESKLLSFRDNALCRSGTLIEVQHGSSTSCVTKGEIKQYLIGDINREGSGSDDWPLIEDDDVVLRCKVLVER